MNKSIKLGAYEIVFNVVFNRFRIKERNKVIKTTKKFKDAVVYLDMLHDKGSINVMDHTHFLSFLIDIEAKRNKPVVGRHSNQAKF